MKLYNYNHNAITNLILISIRGPCNIIRISQYLIKLLIPIHHVYNSTMFCIPLCLIFHHVLFLHVFYSTMLSIPLRPMLSFPLRSVLFVKLKIFSISAQLIDHKNVGRRALQARNYALILAIVTMILISGLAIYSLGKLESQKWYIYR